MSELETLKAITTLDLLPDDIENRVYKLSSFGVMSLGPIVSSFKDEIESALAIEEGQKRSLPPDCPKMKLSG